MGLKRVNQRHYFSRWWHPSNWWDNIKRFFRGFKEDYNRAKYGVSHIDCWDLDYYILKVLQNGLKTYKKDNIGYPGNLTPKKWDNVIDHMIELLDIMLMDESPEVIEAFDNYWVTCGDSIENPGDLTLREEWMKKVVEWEDYKENCRYEFYDLMKEWGRHLWW